MKLKTSQHEYICLTFINGARLLNVFIILDEHDIGTFSPRLRSRYYLRVCYYYYYYYCADTVVQVRIVGIVVIVNYTNK